MQLFFFLGLCKKNVAARCDFQAQNTPKCVCGGVRGNYKASRDCLAGFQGAASRQGRGKGEEKEEKEEREGG